MPESQKKESHVRTQNEACAAVTSQIDCFTQRNSLFNKEVLQVKCSNVHTQHQQYRVEQVDTVRHSCSRKKLNVPPTFCVCSYMETNKMIEEGVLFPLRFSRIYADGDVLNNFQMKPARVTYQNLSSPLM